MLSHIHTLIILDSHLELKGGLSGCLFGSAPMAGVLSLPHLWEGDVCIRSRARHDGQLCAWPDQKLVGIPSIRACVLNATPLTILARWWTAQKDSPAAIPIKLLKSEVWFEKK